jgi:hypothetical protein
MLGQLIMTWQARAAAALVLALLIGGAAWQTWHSAMDMGRAQAQAQCDADKLEALQVIDKAKDDALFKERALQKTADKIRRETQNAISILIHERDDAIDSLRQRQARPADSIGAGEGANDGASAPRCTGVGLFREDAQFLIGEAGRAERARLELKKCLANAQSIERQLNQSKAMSVDD